MNCRDWEERLALYAGGDLPAAESADVERHLNECAGCQVFLSGLTDGLRILTEAHTEGAIDAQLAAVRARVLGEIGRRRRAWWGLAYGLAAAAAVVAVALALRPGTKPVERPRPEPTAPMAVAQPPSVEPVPVAPAPKVRTRRAHYRKRVAPAHTLEPQVAPKPLVVKLVTDDPNVVIYWIADSDTKGEPK